MNTNEGAKCRPVTNDHILSIKPIQFGLFILTFSTLLKWTQKHLYQAVNFNDEGMTTHNFLQPKSE